ncbi:MAG: 2-hydroxyacyl-CoA dehydratase [Candidatus Marinimicrobia bacterium]|jgi:benzoyl-CoA reductase/2-hydroxyglutaryl-CoA dehydratase subunit BcrC/BadD/HgdB|nr:2-hydroxyacyl-CoA dehydratase [Candidatus Neomarinimicrobiota bacterium]MBT3633978.1 2-hydroxyacyl-CoA dehydratase [Candidatus Neomarinimicrobiota bacterium]MBT3683748.1 2-hydroxyacyl-CoA dehydratase [Candidatus Neomarinimicrobiota bacterium]MBT3760628.1 2-hydroxyacyl-CoA dehydratase [Candidatus Neomarinimicrobiota bacterium]MBT3895787.1 2-hydroxyacyl-CoA dehydratase [Candidatus Neomarinimicrobiota bacterium]
MPHLQSQQSLKLILKNYFTGFKSPLAWCTSAGPAEILRALGFDVYFPENHGALLGASRTAEKYIPRAHQEGFGGEICSYLTSDIGAWRMKETPLTKAYGLPSVPKPDLIVYNTNQCREVADWFNFFAEEFDCPVFGIYPPRHLEEIHQRDIDNVVGQFEDLILLGEKVIGNKMTDADLMETVLLSKRGSQLWGEVLNTAQTTPSPITFFDGTILMAPIVVLRGTQICVDFYQEVLEELTQLSSEKISAVAKEDVRIYWEGMPVWGRLKAFSQLFANNNAAVVASTYCNSWIFDDFDENNPLESLALAYTQIFINRGENAKLDMMKDIINNFNIDGVIFHDSKTCFNNSNNRFGLPKKLTDATGISCVTIEGDLNDMRFLSDGQIETKLETFIDQIGSKKGIY